MTLAKSAKIAKEDKEINMENGMDENAIGKAIVDVAIQVHRELGPGLLESVYETILVRPRESENHRRTQVRRELSSAHRKQLLTYLRLAELKLGFLLNFGEYLMKNGVVRTVNGLDNV